LVVLSVKSTLVAVTYRGEVGVCITFQCTRKAKNEKGHVLKHVYEPKKEFDGILILWSFPAIEHDSIRASEGPDELGGGMNK